MRVLVCGGRDFTNRDLLHRVLNDHHKRYGITAIIEGNARGADRLAGYWARSNKIDNEKYPANWKKYGKAAGPIRNQEMITVGCPDIVIAFPGGKGTEDMIRKAEQANISTLSIVDRT